MREHHREAVDAVVEDVRADDEFLACVLTGSVARGWERPDSDVDFVIVTTDADYERRRSNWDLQYYREDVCDREGVYADGKIVDRAFLEEVAEHGSEPARSAFVDASVEWTADAAIKDTIEEIPVYPEDERIERIQTCYSQMQAYRWFVDEAAARENPYLRSYAATQLALFGGRLLLANDGTLFPYHKWLSRQLEEIEATPPRIVDRMETLVEAGTPEAADAFVEPIEAFRDWETPEAGWPVRFMVDREWQWRRGEPGLEEL
jgi:predicted nucleotidyltransferase